MAGTWQSITPPNISSGAFNADTMLLLTDGSVLVHHAYGGQWLRLTPDAQGQYATGSWSSDLTMANSRQFFASGILMDGRVFAIGGEYSDDAGVPSGSDTPLGEIFDPQTNSWSVLAKPAAFNWIQGDAASCILPDGRVLLGALNTNQTALWDPSNGNWSEAGLAFGAAATPTKSGVTDEETWTLLPDGTVMAAEIGNAPATEKYVPSLDQWVTAGSTSQSLVVPSINGTNVSEIGPAVVLPNGDLFAIGATGHTALYTVPVGDPSLVGTWSPGPDFPADTSGNNFLPIFSAIDAPACLLPYGKVLCVAGATQQETDSNGNVSYWSNPTTFFEYDPSTKAFTQLAAQPSNNTSDTWTGRLLLLPTGQVLFTSQQNQISIYTPDPADGAPDPAWKPAIANCPSAMVQGHTYVITGTQLNGLSQAVAYGDDAQAATNYPLVRLENVSTGDVAFMRTFGFSTLGIATGMTPQSFNVEVPGGLATGAWNLVVIANGIASDPVAITVAAQDAFFILDRSNIGQGEIKALINLNGTPATIDPVFYVVVEGFSPSDLGLTLSNLANPPQRPAIPSPIPSISFEFSGKVMLEDPALPPTPQRFTFPFRAVFQDDSAFNFSGQTQPLSLTATITGASATVSCGATIMLLKKPNPFILDGDSANNFPWYLSVDIRVFQVPAGATRFAAQLPATGSPGDIATTFITQVINNLNASPGSAGGEFEALQQDEDAAALQIAPTDSGGTPIFNFALARVRYRDIQPVTNVRLFFRMWPAQQTNATYDSTTTYRSAVNGAGQKIPLLGVQGDEIVTIPFFATPRVDATSVSMATQTDPANVHAAIQPDPLGGEVDTYFGCWLDINQTDAGDQIFPSRMVGATPANLPDGPFVNTAPMVTIQQLVRSAHQCLIAEISFDDPDPIPSSADPSTSDKLAQRNLAFVGVPNPGVDLSRRAPQTFEMRPTPRFLRADLKPDELMIDWGNTPTGSVANIYLPAAEADEILALARQLYTTHRLSKVDAHTLQCPTDGVTFMPIPKGEGANYAGLLTIDFPKTVRRGEGFAIVVRQVTSAIGSAQTGGDKSRVINWRRVLGGFQITIPVGTKGTLLEPEEKLLSIMRWIGQSIPLESRWFPVFQRYVEQIAGRVGGMGGNPILVGPSPTGDWKKTGATVCTWLLCATATLLAALVVALGALTGPWLVGACVVLGMLLIVVAAWWLIHCRPSCCRILKCLIAGDGVGAAVLAILAFLGVTTHQLLLVLAASIVIAVIAGIVGTVWRCFQGDCSTA